MKLIIRGTRTYGDLFNLGEVGAQLWSIALDSPDYNIAEFILDIPDYLEHGVSQDFETSANVEYLLEDPAREFKEYILSTRSRDLKEQNLDPDYLAKLFVTAMNGDEVNENN